MSNKRNKIALLKQKITNLQHQLTSLQEKSKEDKKSNKNSPFRTPERSASFKERYKSPTYWNTNPITYSQQYTIKKEEQLTPERRIKRNKHEEVTRQLLEIINTVDSRYYEHPRQVKRQEESKYQKQISSKINKNKRFQNSFYGKQGYKSKPDSISRKKMYSPQSLSPKNPQTSKHKGLKLDLSKNKSPKNPYIHHPASNQNQFTYPNKTLYLQRKGQLHDHNQSKIVLSSSLGQLVPIKFDIRTTPKRKKSQRKHFDRYFNDYHNFQSVQL